MFWRRWFRLQGIVCGNEEGWRVSGYSPFWIRLPFLVYPPPNLSSSIFIILGEPYYTALFLCPGVSTDFVQGPGKLYLFSLLVALLGFWGLALYAYLPSKYGPLAIETGVWLRCTSAETKKSWRSCSHTRGPTRHHILGQQRFSPGQIGKGLSSSVMPSKRILPNQLAAITEVKLIGGTLGFPAAFPQGIFFETNTNTPPQNKDLNLVLRP